MMYLLRFAAFFVTIGSVSALATLTCFICGDNNLDEFGECGTQFQYDCASYAKRFPPTERIFCRTSRHRASNNTYTVMKECISERDHFKTFPEKNYALEDECDLLEMDGYEVAYCLCSQNLCNRKPITEQFLEFEKANPEVFAASSDADPLPPPIRPINDPHSSSADEQKLQAARRQPSSFIGPPNPQRNDVGIGRTPAEFEIDPPENLLPTSTLPGNYGRSHPPAIAPPLNAVTGQSLVRSHETVDVNPPRLPPRDPFADNTRNVNPTSANPTEFLRSPSPQALTCMQCGQGNLLDEAADCVQQVPIRCVNSGSRPNSRSFCFTRQILIGPGENAVEKMCVTQEALIQEYGVQVPLDGCTMASGDRVRFCVCDTSNCNRASLNQQKDSQFAFQMVIQQPNLFFSSSTSSTFRPTTTTSAIQIRPPFRCEVCSENDVTDTTTDCRRSFAFDCSQHYGNTQPVFCMTRQTQLQEGLFNLEKRCVSRTDFEQNFPDTQLRIGCASAFDASVSFCICDGDLCNRGSIFNQAQRLTGDERPELPPFLTSSPFPSSRPNFPQSTQHIIATSTATLARQTQPPVLPIITTHPHHILADEESHQLSRPTTIRPTTTTAPRPLPSPATRPAPEEFLLQQRQQRWQEEPNDFVVPDSAISLQLSTVITVFCAALLVR